MKKSKNVEDPMELIAWRGRRRRGERIPEALWDAATEAAMRYGVEGVSRQLEVDYERLKKRVEKRGSQGRAPVFVELQGEASAAPTACVVELEKGNGGRMRICLSESSGVDWCRIKEAFLGA